MDIKLVIVEWKSQILTVVYEDEQMVELLFDDISGSLLGNIYVGKVKNIVKNINAAFVEIEGGQYGFYSLTENTFHLYTNNKTGVKMVPGDELLVQVIKDPIKTKLPLLDGHMTIPGSNLVLTVNKSFVGVSSKIVRNDEKRRLKSILEPLVTDAYGFIARTEAQDCDEALLLEEARGLIAEYERIMNKAKYSLCYAKLYSGMPSYLKYIQSHPDISKITTDMPQVKKLLDEAKENLKFDAPVVFYEDETWPLIKLKSLETHMHRAINPLVRLKSGGFLMIQPTEALVSIDVNTGKYTGKKTVEETFFKINAEAAKEIGRQLRLRNLSGIILIDFIDMKDPMMRHKLLEEFSKVLARDSVKTVLVGMTKLNLVEMTRKKEHRPLHEQLNTTCPKCHGIGYLYEND